MSIFEDFAEELRDMEYEVSGRKADVARIEGVGRETFGLAVSNRLRAAHAMMITAEAALHDAAEQLQGIHDSAVAAPLVLACGMCLPEGEEQP